jgi:hypothetical protein
MRANADLGPAKIYDGRMLRTILILAALSGCSAIIMDKPKTAQSAGRGSCTTSKVFPIIDSAIAGALAATAVGAEIALGSDSDTKNVVAGAALMAGIFYLASGGTGFDNAKECRAREKR